MNDKLNILSLGLGVQSTAIYLMSALGELPRIDCAIFADPGGEKRKTYEYLEWLKQWAIDHDAPTIIIAKDRSIEKDLFKKDTFVRIPAFTKNDDGSVGMIRRQCTNEYKIEVVDRAIRELYKLATRKRNIPTNIWKGISIDEFQRVSKPYEKWKTFIYPLCGYGIPSIEKPYKLDFGTAMSRFDLYKWYSKHELPIPPKSSCKFCPFLSDKNWSSMKKNEPNDFADSVKIDYAIRNSTETGIKNPIYLHKSCKPLDQIHFDETKDIPFGECSGTCNT